jgi:hypothetical protein
MRCLRLRTFKPWNDPREPLELFVSPTVKEAAELPRELKTTTEYLEVAAEYSYAPIPPEKPRRRERKR